MNGHRVSELCVVVVIGILLILLAFPLFARMMELTRNPDRMVYVYRAVSATALGIIVAVVSLCWPRPKNERGVWRVSIFAHKQAPLSVDTMYEQLYIEMRRYRDHEQGVVTWWTSILLAVVAGMMHFSTREQGIHYGVRVGLVIALVWLSSAMTCLIDYTNRRYHDLRKHTNKYYDHVFQPRPELTVMRIGGFIRTLIPMWIVTIGACALLGFADLIPLGCR